MRVRLSESLVWAAVGAGVFLGVGASLPVWTTTPFSLLVDSAWQQGPLWDAAVTAIRDRQRLNQFGVTLPLVAFEDEFVLGPLLLVVFGAGAGLACFGARGLVTRMLKGRKGRPPAPADVLGS